MRRLLDMLVPALADFALLSVRNGDEDLVLTRNQHATASSAVESLPRSVQRAVEEAVREGWQMHVRVKDASGEWPEGLSSARVLPLQVADRNIGLLVLAVATPSLSPPEDGTLNEIVNRAAIAFDNAALYNSLKRETARSKEAEEKLQEASRRKDEFLAMLSHELRNPLAPILSASEVMRKLAPADPAIRWARDVVERQVTHLAQLVDDLLDVSRITQGKITLMKEPVELERVIRHSIETTTSLLDAKRHRLELEFPPNSVWVHGDFARLSQVFGNLLNNAAKYTSDGGRLEIAVTAEQGQAIVAIRDNGIGIEPQFLPHVFEVFSQGDRTLDRTQGGLGVGLAVVRRLVELHQGRVEVVSPGIGAGTQVQVFLPCVSEVGEGTKQAAFEQSVPTPCGGKRVLVVDDNADAAESIAVFLRLEGHEVKTVSDGLQALASLPVFAPQIALVDIGLPGMDGYDVARHMADSVAGRPELLIALTGYGQTEDIERSRAAGFHHHFVKPADPRAIQAVIAQVDAAAPAGGAAAGI
jgi:signal transduction histidine kinase/ActR/RegA family two-component response regulator